MFFICKSMFLTSMTLGALTRCPGTFKVGTYDSYSHFFVNSFSTWYYYGLCHSRS